MNLFEIDLDSLRTPTIEVFTYLYGEEYASIIEKKVENAILLYYLNSSVVSNYISYLKKFKSSEFFSKFLDKIELESILDKTTKSNQTTLIKKDEYYKQIENINDISSKHSKLINEYLNLEKNIKIYTNYVKTENSKYINFCKQKRVELLKEIFPKLPIELRIAMKGKKLLEKEKMLFISSDLDSITYVERFNKEHMDLLNSNNINIENKKLIILDQIRYLSRIGLNYPYINLEKSEIEIKNYLNFLKRKEISKYLPSEELMQCIENERKIKLEDVNKQFFYDSSEYFQLKNIFGDDIDFIESIYKKMKGNEIFIDRIGFNYQNDEFASLMLYTPIEIGKLFFVFLHEMGHVIDQNEKGCGFEPIDNFMKNQYNQNFRKYEIFNESINNIFAIKATEYFQNQGIYYMEPKEVVDMNLKNNNSTTVTNNLLEPFVQKFSKEIIRSKINVDQSQLKKCIGNDNFEDLIDTINKIDYLSRNGLNYKIKESSNDWIKVEFKNQLSKIKQIYKNIDAFNNNRILYSSSDNLQDSLENKEKNYIKL